MTIVYRPTDYLPCYIYIDGNYVRMDLKARRLPVEFNPRLLIAVLKHHLVMDRPLIAKRLFFYDAVDEAGIDVAESKRYLTQVEQLPDTAVRRGFVRHSSKPSKRTQPSLSDELKDAADRVVYIPDALGDLGRWGDWYTGY
jgi:hypothetical protein